MDAPPADASPSSGQKASEPREDETFVRYYRIDFERCVIQQGRRARRGVPAEER